MSGCGGVLGVARGSREWFSAWISEYEGVFEGHVIVYAVGFDDVFAASPEMVYAEAVFVFVYDLEKTMTESLELRVVHRAFEDGILNALSEILACRGNMPEPPPPRLRLGIHVVCHEDVHVPHFGVNGRYASESPRRWRARSRA